MGELLTTVKKVKSQINPNLAVDGVLITLIDERTNLGRETINVLRENYGSILKVYNSKIPIAVKAAESTIEGKSIFEYSKNNKVAQAYYEFALEVDNYGKEKTKNELNTSR